MNHLMSRNAKTSLICITFSAVIMLLFPFFTVHLVDGDNGMAVCFMLFFAINPVYSAICGVAAGTDMKHLWFLPVMNAVLFLAGTWLIFTMGEPAFAWYAIYYLIIGLAAMLLSAFIKKFQSKKN